MSNGKENKLTYKEARFVEYFDGNPTEAARKAGYATPDRRGWDIIRREKIQKAIEQRETRERRPHIADRKRRQEFWTQVMEDSEQQMKDRLKASEYLGKSEADFVERREHSGQDGEPIQHEHGTIKDDPVQKMFEALEQQQGPDEAQ